MFLSHTSCPVCPSSDAYALYSGGSGYCFSCGHYRPGSGSPYLSIRKISPVEEEKPMLDVPADSGFEYSPSVVDWALLYGVSINTLIENNVLYSPSRSQLIFTFYKENEKNFLVSPGGSTDAFGKPVLWQARNFAGGGGKEVPKYFTQGEKEKLLPVFRNFSDNGVAIRDVVVVEDCISALKMASVGAIGMPCLGSTIGVEKITRLRAAFPRSTRFFVWLDSNMYNKAQQISQRLKLVGAQSVCVWTEQDPKCYSPEHIKQTLWS